MRCFVGGFSFGRRMVPEAGAFLFDRRMTWNIIFRERYKQFVTPYVLRLISFTPRSQVDTGCRQSPTARGCVSCGVKRMAENPMERGA